MYERKHKPRWWLYEFESNRIYAPWSDGWWKMTRSAFTTPFYLLLIGLGLWTREEGYTLASGHWTLQRPSRYHLSVVFYPFTYWLQNLYSERDIC